VLESKTAIVEVLATEQISDLGPVTAHEKTGMHQFGTILKGLRVN